MAMIPLALLGLCLGLLCGALVMVIFLGRRTVVAKVPFPVENALEITTLKNQLRVLESRYHAQLEFFVSFPEVVKALTAALSQEQVTSACSRGLTTLLHTQSIGIFLTENDTHLRLVDGAGFPKSLRYSLSCPMDEAGLTDILVYRGVSRLDERSPAQDFLKRHGLPDDLSVPIWYGEQRLGAIFLAKAKGEDQVVRRMMAMMADLTGVGLHAASQVSQIRNKAESDELTGLANRRALQARITLEIQRCVSYQTCTSLAMIDVDHFKQYNDQNGHQAGDLVLKRITQLMSATTRRTDLVARYGGEEFTVILVGADPDQAFRHAERIRKTIFEHDFPHGGKQPLGRVSISVGLATFPRDAMMVEDLFEAADQALYRAKHLGRNRVISFDQQWRQEKPAYAIHNVSNPADPSPP